MPLPLYIDSCAAAALSHGADEPDQIYDDGLMRAREMRPMRGFMSGDDDANVDEDDVVIDCADTRATVSIHV